MRVLVLFGGSRLIVMSCGRPRLRPEKNLDEGGRQAGGLWIKDDIVWRSRNDGGDTGQVAGEVQCSPQVRL